MAHSSRFDVFNGDADGIIARHQYRLVHPAQTTAITGVKRDVALLDQLAGNASVTAGDQIFVFDISYDANYAAATKLLERGVMIHWFDHHRADHLTPHTNLVAHIDTSADTCTSLIVDKLINGGHRHWAIAAAFGDNLIEQAEMLANLQKLSPDQNRALRQLGEVINYNAYGDTVEDLLVAPAALADYLQSYANPFDFINQSPLFRTLADGFADDMAVCATLEASVADDTIAAYVLPDSARSRRVSGTFANHCARIFPKRAHIIATTNTSGIYTVSLRAPLNQPVGADLIAARFGGGGRKIAAGINALPIARLDELIAITRATYARRQAE